MSPVTNAIPVIDICSLSGAGQRHSDLIAERFGAYLKVHPNLHRPHGHSFYHLVLFTRGAGSHTIDFRRYAVRPGQMYFMAPGQVHSWAFDEEVDGFVINFSEDMFPAFLADRQYLERFPFLSGEASDPVILLEGSSFSNAVQILEDAVREYERPEAFNGDMLCLLLLSLFIVAARATASGTPAADKAHPSMLLLQNFRKLLNRYYHQYKLPKDYAALLYVTPNHLNAVCNELLGKPAGEIIRERILLEAKRMLVNAHAGIADIGYQLGFTDNSYFTKFFKKYTGMTPESFRRDLQVPSS